MKKNRLKLGLGILTVLSTPIAVNTVASSDALAAQGWVKSGNTWYFYNQNGTLAKNAWAGNYWLGADGKMVTNAWVDNNRYYVGNDGAWIKNYGNKSGWQKEGSTWYYYKNGTLVRNAWEGNYWLGSDGRMATNSWVDSNRYYVGNDGAWIKDYGNKSGWQKEGSTWYYYKNGSAVRNTWIGNYWLGADGKMATSSWVDNGRYYVDGNGLWVPDYSKTSKNIPALNMLQYYQGDARWGGKLYGIGTMAQSGCVPTALAMAFSGLGQNVLPTAVANTIYNNTNEMNVEGLGTSGAGAVYAINAYGYKHTVLTTKEQLIAALQSGKPVFATVGNGIFAKGSLTHAIILSGYSDGKTKAMDPDNAYTTGRWYDINTIWNQRSTDPYDTNIGGSFVAIG